MRAVIQRVQSAQVVVASQVIGQINQGLLILVGFESSDDTSDITWMSQKIANMRIFSDEEGKMNLSVQDIKGSVLVVSQFTLHASTKKGNRPSFVDSARPELAIPLYEAFLKEIAETGLPLSTGQFGADMKVSLVNDGPVTILIDSKNRY